MNRLIRSIGIMGGTFDPIHYGHLVTAEAARCEFKLDKVVFVPSGQPPHKENQIITEAFHRFRMTEAAIRSNPHFEISREEMDRPGPSYAVDTVKHFQHVYGPEAKIYFITGADAILEILTWKNVEELIESCCFIAATRPGYQLNELREHLRVLQPHHLERILNINVPAMAISSTEIRDRVAESRSIKYLLPEAVEKYIKQNNLYKDVCFP